MEGLILILASIEFFTICWFAENRTKLLKRLKSDRHIRCVLSRNITRLQRENDCLRNENSVAEAHIATLTDSSACPSCQRQGDVQWHEQKPKPDVNQQRAYYESLVTEAQEIRATLMSKQHMH